MDFLADDSVQRILVIAGGVLGLFGVYFVLALLSNRSVHRLADSLRRRGRGERRPVKVERRSPLLGPLGAALLAVAAAGLIVFLVWTTRVLR